MEKIKTSINTEKGYTINKTLFKKIDSECIDVNCMKVDSNLCNVINDVKSIVDYLKSVDQHFNFSIILPSQIRYIEKGNQNLQTKKEELDKQFKSLNIFNNRENSTLRIKSTPNKQRKKSIFSKINDGLQAFGHIMKVAEHGIEEILIENIIEHLNKQYATIKSISTDISKSKLKLEQENTNDRVLYEFLAIKSQMMKQVSGGYEKDIDYNWLVQKMKINETLQKEGEYIKLFDQYMLLKIIYLEQFDKINMMINNLTKYILKGFVVSFKEYSEQYNKNELKQLITRIVHKLDKLIYAYKKVEFFEDRLPAKDELFKKIEEINLQLLIIEEDALYLSKNETLNFLKEIEDIDSFYSNYKPIPKNDDFENIFDTTFTTQNAIYHSNSDNDFKNVITYKDEELQNLIKELESLKSKLQTLVEQKIEHLNNIEEFNREYNLHLGGIIREILNLKKEILYKKTIKQQKQKAIYKEELQTFEETKETIDELKTTINELEEGLKSIDASHENYEEIKNAYEELQEELRKLEDELELQEEALENVKEFIEYDAIKEEYEEAKSHYDEYENDYEQIKQEQKDVIKLDDDEKAELKKFYKKAARLCHPDMVAKPLKDKAHEIMQALNAAYSKKDLAKIKEILHSLESGTTLTTASDVIEDKETLKNKVKEFKNAIAELKGEIEEIQKDDTFQIIAELDDWDAYFEELKSKLNKEKEKLEEEAKELLEESEELTQEIKVVKIKQSTKAKEKTIQKEDKTPYTEHILSIENTNFEKIRRYCENLSKSNEADEMQKYLAENGKMHKALIYDALEQFIAQLNAATITLVDWGCDQGIASMIVLDYMREKQLDIKVALVILIDSNKAKLSRAMTQIEAISHDEIKIIALNSDDEELLDTLKINKNNIKLNLFANDKMPIDSLDIDFDIFENDYFMCVSNESKEFVDKIYEDITPLMNCHDLSIRDGKIGRFQRYERIFFTEEKNQDPWDLPF